MEFRACFVLLIVCAIAVSGKHLHGKPHQNDYIQHKTRVEKFQKENLCSVPKETIVPISEVTFRQPFLANEIISPPVTVLHRCESCSGCDVKSGYSCTAKTSEKVHLTFYVFENNNTATKDFRIGIAQNHTSCWCQPTSSIPK